MSIDMTQFSEKQITAIAFLSLPNHGGLTFEEVAEQSGISLRQLHRWRKQPEFKQAIVEQALNNVKDSLPEVLQAHEKQAKSGNVNAIKLFYELLGLLVTKQEITQEVTNKDKGNDDLESELNDIRSLIDEIKG